MKLLKKLVLILVPLEKPVGGNDYYSLSYAEFVVPLVKAVQELSEQNKQLQNKVEALTAN